VRGECPLHGQFLAGPRTLTPPSHQERVSLIAAYFLPLERMGRLSESWLDGAGRKIKNEDIWTALSKLEIM
jgi:hypothetical protein